MTPSRDDELEKAANVWLDREISKLGYPPDEVESFLAGARYQQGRDAKRPPSSHAADATSYAIISELQSQLLQSQAQVEKMREVVEAARKFYRTHPLLRESYEVALGAALAKLDEGQK